MRHTTSHPRLACDIIAEARASLQNPTRPFTPRDSARSLFPLGKPDKPGVLSRPSSRYSINPSSFLEPPDSIGGEGIPLVKLGRRCSIPRRLTPINTCETTSDCQSPSPTSTNRTPTPHQPNTPPSTQSPKVQKSIQRGKTTDGTQAADEDKNASVEESHDGDDRWNIILSLTEVLNDRRTLPSAITAALHSLAKALDSYDFETFSQYFVDRTAPNTNNQPATCNLKKKDYVLKSLVRFLDDKSEYNGIVIGASSVALQVASDARFISVICKLLFKLSKCEANDVHFKSFRLTELFPALIDSTLDHISSAVDISGNRFETLLYSSGSLKNVSNEISNQDALAHAGCVHVMSRCVIKFINVLSEHTKPDINFSKAAQFLVQVTATLRNLTGDNRHHHLFKDALVVENLMGLLGSPAELLTDVQPGVLLNSVRVLSKLCADEFSTQQIIQSENGITQLVRLLMSQHSDKDLSLRIMYILGTLSCASPNGETVTAHSSLGRYTPDFVSLFSMYVRKEIGSCSAFTDCPPTFPRKRTNGEEEVLIKLIRILANISLEPDSGANIAAMPEAASALISLLDNKTALVVLEGSKDDSDKGQDTYKTNELPDTLEELVLNIVGLLNNLSYYGNKEENGIFLRGGDVIRCLTSLLYHENPEIVAESIGVLANMSRDSPDIRAEILRKSVGQIATSLLNHSHRDVQNACCGLLMNLITSEEQSEQLCKEMKELRAPESLTDIISEGAEIGDWNLASTASKALHNYICHVKATDPDLKDSSLDVLPYTKDVLELILGVEPLGLSGEQQRNEIDSTFGEFCSAARRLADCLPHID